MMVMSDTTVKVLAFKGLVVLMEFDNGAETCFWLVPMAADELEKWWLRQETFNDNPPEAQECGQLLAEIFNETWEPKKVWRFEWPGEFVDVKSDEESNLWQTLSETGNHYFCHVYDDSDSFLITPTGRRLHHAGYNDQQGP